MNKSISYIILLIAFPSTLQGVKGSASYKYDHQGFDQALLSYQARSTT